MGKATDFKFGRHIHRVHLNKSPLKIFEKRDRRHIRGLPKFFGYPILSQERVKPWTSNLADTFTESIRTKARSKFLRKGSVGIYRDCPIFWVPPILSRTKKATNFKFGRYIQRVHPNKSPFKIVKKREHGHT